MTLAEALDLAVAKTGVERYRVLCDRDHAAYDERYEAIVFAIAEGRPLPIATPQPPAAIPAAPSEAESADWQARATRGIAVYIESQRLRILAEQCPHRSCKTGCGNAVCDVGRGDQAGGTLASLPHCIAVIAECEKIG